ncbi:MAG TPA: hypothetical protein PLD47_01800 [Aggregatilineales bacterium]|nr:hypothetical protein [Anaerolineales bacterium]HRE46432.1 hypothetical protein [Aggregatilineales bacterium]
MSDFEAYKQWILAADPRALVSQLDDEVRAQLVSSQNLINILVMMQNPSPKMQARIESGELNATQMLEQITGHIEQAFTILDFFKKTLEGE